MLLGYSTATAALSSAFNSSSNCFFSAADRRIGSDLRDVLLNVDARFGVFLRLRINA
jgi:hypothetical protein